MTGSVRKSKRHKRQISEGSVRGAGGGGGGGGGRGDGGDRGGGGGGSRASAPSTGVPLQSMDTTVLVRSTASADTRQDQIDASNVSHSTASMRISPTSITSSNESLLNEDDFRTLLKSQFLPLKGISRFKVTGIVGLEDNHVHSGWPDAFPVKLLRAREAAGIALSDTEQHWIWPVWTEIRQDLAYGHLLLATYHNAVMTIFDPFNQSIGYKLADYPILYNLWDCLDRPVTIWEHGNQPVESMDCAVRTLRRMQKLCLPVVKV